MVLTVTVDRVVDGIAVLVPEGAQDGRDQILWPARFLPPTAGEGKVLDLQVAVSEGKTDEARRRVGGLLEELERLSGDGKGSGGQR
jgi:hypothetical protein